MACSMAAAEMGMRPALIGGAEEKYVHGQMAGKQALRNAGCVDVNVAALLRAVVDQVDNARRPVQHHAAANHVAGGNFGGVDYRDGARRMGTAQVVGVAGAKQVEPQDQVGVAVADLGGSLNGSFAENDTGDHGATLLREPRLIERDDRQIIQPGRRGQQRIDGNDTGAANSRREDRVAVTGREPSRGAREPRRAAVAGRSFCGDPCRASSSR